MTERLVENEHDRRLLIRYIEHQPLPFRAKLTAGRLRSLDQNRLQWLWAAEAALQRQDITAREVQNEWKLLFGIPSLCTDDPVFAEGWAEVEKLPYRKRLLLMQLFSVTSVMTQRQMKAYLDDVYRFNTENGIQLTVPEDLKWMCDGKTLGRRMDRSDTRHADTAAGKAACD
jgi:hypothetical protein